jgi:prephenate dehydrogenase
VELSAAGQERLKAGLGLDCVSSDESLPDAECIILAVPDTAIGKLSQAIEPQLKSGTMIMALDAAAPFAGHLPERGDLTYFVTHPCHPPVFNDETDLEAKRDYFGGVAAKQHIVCCLMQGPDEAYADKSLAAMLTLGGSLTFFGILIFLFLQKQEAASPRLHIT